MKKLLLKERIGTPVSNPSTPGLAGNENYYTASSPISTSSNFFVTSPSQPFFEGSNSASTPGYNQVASPSVSSNQQVPPQSPMSSLLKSINEPSSGVYNNTPKQMINQQGPLPSLGFLGNPHEIQGYSSLQRDGYALPSINSYVAPVQEKKVDPNTALASPSFSIPSTVLSSPIVDSKKFASNFSMPESNVFQKSHYPNNTSVSPSGSSSNVEKTSGSKSTDVATIDSPIVEYMDDDDGWVAQWFNEEKRQKWKLKVPQFKYCKKRKEHFDKSFPDTWYKAPYKYHMHLEIGNMLREENVMANIDLHYEDGQKVVNQKSKEGKKGKKKKKSSEGSEEATEDDDKKTDPVITNNESYFNFQTAAKSTVTIGPFMYNICSYKQDGKKFRMVVHLYILTNSTPYHPFQQQPQPADTASNAVLCCCLISPSFTIRAKKPIVKPGIKSKRKKGEEDESDDEMDAPPSPTGKKVKNSLGEASIPNFHPHAGRGLANGSEVYATHPVQNVEATQAIDELLESMYKNNAVFDPSMLGGMNVGSSSQPVNSEEKIKNITETFQGMADTDRKKLLCNIVETCLPHEREFLYRKYFESSGYNDFGDSYPSYPSNSSATNQQSEHLQKMLQQYQMIQQQQQDLFAYFTAINNNVQGVPIMMAMPTQQMVTDGSSAPSSINDASNYAQSVGSSSAPTRVNPANLAFASNHQPSDVDQFFVELFD